MVRVYNEAAWIVEWLEFHRMQGVERFLVYDDQSTDELELVLAPYVDAGLVDLVRWDHRCAADAGGLGAQYVAPPAPGVDPRNAVMTAPFRHALDRLKRTGEARWLLAIDADEFVYCVRSPPLRLVDVLPQLERYAGVAINWHMHGTAGVEHKPPAPVTSLETFTRCESMAQPVPLSTGSMSGYVKCLVQVARVDDFPTPHVAAATTSDAYGVVDTNGVRVTNPYWAPGSYDELRVAHYWTRDEHHARRHKQALRRRAGYAEFDDQQWYEATLAALNAAPSDGAILRFVPELRARLEAPFDARPPTYAAAADVHNAAVLSLLDWQWYLARYDDLRRAGVTNRSAAERHWIAHGKREGRHPNAAHEASRQTQNDKGV